MEFLSVCLVSMSCQIKNSSVAITYKKWIQKLANRKLSQNRSIARIEA